MPGARKSNVSIVTNDETDSPAPATKSKQQDGISVEDLNLPKTMINRLAKGVLPSNTQIQKDALLALSKSATVFISYIAAHADEWASMSGRKTISPNDVYNALKEYEYQAFLPRVQAEVAKYNEVQCDKRNSYRKRVKADKAAVDPEDGKDTDAMDDTDAAISNAVANGKRSGEDEPPSKKIRREPGDEVDDGDEDVEDEAADDEPEEDEDGEEDDGEEAEDEEAEDDEQAEEGMQEDDDDLVSGEIRDEALDELDSD